MRKYKFSRQITFVEVQVVTLEDVPGVTYYFKTFFSTYGPCFEAMALQATFLCYQKRKYSFLKHHIIQKVAAATGKRLKIIFDTGNGFRGYNLTPNQCDLT